MDFVKKEWQFRDIISENELNRMEDGIEEGITKAEQAQDDLNAHINATTGVHGATSTATPNTLVQRDPAGRFKAAAPAASDDVARKAEVDAHATRTDNPHGTTAAQVGAPSLTITIPSGVSLNTVVTSGFYRLTDNHPDAPPGVDYGQMIVSRGGDTVLQIVTGFNYSHFYMRHGNPPEAGGQGVWQPWRRLWHDGNDGHGSGLDADMLDGAQLSSDANAWTVAQRMGDGTIKASGWGFQIMSPYGIANYIGVGNGDGASYTTHNIKFRGWNGMGMYDYADNCNGYYDFRAGKWDVKGGYYVNGNTVWHAGNFPYEIGTWTPNVEIGGINASYASRSGTYIRIGDLVYWTFHVELSSKNGGTGAITIGAFPFPIGPTNGIIPMGKINGAAFPSWVYWAHLLVPWDGATFFYLQASGNFYGDYALTGDHIANISILAASGVCRISP